jgi:hypothetical protein
MTWAFLGVFIPSASAEGCPDVEAIFASGTTETPGVGGIGQAFVDSLQSKVGPKSFGVYAVDYPASTDFHTALDGINDAGDHVESMAASCPKTKMVQVVIGPLYQPKTLELCAPDDPVCSDGGDWAAHAAYADDGMVDRAANFAASHL